MNYKIIITTFSVLSLIACNNPDSNKAEDTTTDQQTMQPETNPTPGQQLDTAIKQTKEAAQNTKNDIKDAGNDIKEKAKNTAEDVKQSAKDANEKMKADAQKAKEHTKKDINVIKEKSKEAKEEIKNN